MASLVRIERDLRVDIARGFALWCIFVNHTPGNWLSHVTPRNYMLADATEIFVLLAGYAAGLAYGGLMDRQGWPFAASRVAGRVSTLYVAHIFLLVVFTAQVGFSAARLDSAAYLDELHLDPFAADPYRALLEALLLRYQPAFLNILPLYIVVLALFGLALPLARWPGPMLAASAALWAAARLFGLALPSWRGEDWFFNPLAWQLLLFVGVALGYRPPGGAAFTVPWRRWLGALCWLVLIAGGAMAVLIHLRWDIAEARLPSIAPFLAAIDKTALHPLRLATILAASYLVAHGVRRGAGWLRSRPALVLALLGQQGLPVFCAGIAFSFLARLALEAEDGWAMQLAVNLAGAAALVAIAAVAAWYGAEKRALRRPAPPPLPHPAATDRG